MISHRNKKSNETFDWIFLELAKKDLEAAYILFSHNIYHLSIFLLQQAIEKAIKSFGIWAQTITLNEAKKEIGHKALLFYPKLFEQAENGISRIYEIAKQLPQYKEKDFMKGIDLLKWKNKIQAQNQLLKTSIKKIYELTDFSSKDSLLKIKNEIVKLKKKMQRDLKLNILPKQELNNLKKGYNKVTKWLFENLHVPDNARKELKRNTLKHLIEIYKYAKKILFRSYYVLLILFYLALIFTPHTEKSRYPQSNSNPLQIYDSRMPLIQTFDTFSSITEETLKDLEDIYNLSRNMNLRYQNFLAVLQKYAN